MFLELKNSYLIHVLLKSSSFILGEIVIVFYPFWKNFIKNIKARLQLNKKYGNSFKD